VAGRVNGRLVAVLIVLGSLVGVAGVFAVWLDRQALDTDEWTNTSSRLLENSQIRAAVAEYEVNELYANVDVAGELAQVFPRRARPLAGPAAAGLRLAIQQAAQRALGTPLALRAWRQANRVAHRQLLAAINGGEGPVSTSGGNVTLNLNALVQQIAGQGGSGISLPAGAAQLEVLHSDQLDTAQQAARWIRDLTLILILLGVSLYAAAVVLARGWRRVALRGVGIGAIAAGIVALIARGVIGHHVVQELSRDPTVKPAADEVWSIGSSLLSETAIFLMIDGLFIVCAAALAGPTPMARGIRGMAAPYLRDRPVVTYAGLGVVFLLLTWWGPTLAFREPISLAVIAVLLVVGTEALRRQTAREFPEAGSRPLQEHPWWTRVRERAGEAVPRVRPTFARLGSSSRAHDQGGPLSPSELDSLRQLADLRERGALSEEEFAEQKARILEP
jgi:Short C-terminal domain